MLVHRFYTIGLLLGRLVLAAFDTLRSRHLIGRKAVHLQLLETQASSVKIEEHTANVGLFVGDSVGLAVGFDW